MTKRREANSRHDALRDACQHIGYDVASAVTGRSENYLHRAGDPDSEVEPTVWLIETLDRELKARGEEPWNTLALAARIGGRPITAQTHLARAAREIGQATKLIEARPADLSAYLEIQRALTEIVADCTRLTTFFLDLHERQRECRASVVGLDRERRA